MMTKEKALYQVKLILEALPEEEYQLISKDTLEYIEKNYEYDENIKIDSNIPLESQNVDMLAYEILEPIVKEAEEKIAKKQAVEDKLKEKEFNENIRLNELNAVLEKEKVNISKAKELIVSYKKLLQEKQNEIDNLKEYNNSLEETVNRIPKFLRKIFLKKSDIKLINGKNDVL